MIDWISFDVLFILSWFLNETNKQNFNILLGTHLNGELCNAIDIFNIEQLFLSLICFIISSIWSFLFSPVQLYPCFKLYIIYYSSIRILKKYWYIFSWFLYCGFVLHHKRRSQFIIHYKKVHLWVMPWEGNTPSNLLPKASIKEVPGWMSTLKPLYLIQ